MPLGRDDRVSQLLRKNQNERTVMLKHFRVLGVAGLTTLSASQPTFAGPNNVLWSHNQSNGEVIVSGIKTAARTISRLNPHHTLVRFNHHQAGGVALVPLMAYGAQDDRCSPDFDVAPFRAEKGSEVWANFEFVNVAESDMDLLAFGIKADKPGRKDRFRVDHDIGRSRLGNKPGMVARIAPPAEGDLGYYFLDRGILRSDELLYRNPGAAIKITISNHARGPAV